MYMKVSVVTKFYDAKIYKNIHNRMHIVVFYLYTETTQKINKCIITFLIIFRSRNFSNTFPCMKILQNLKFFKQKSKGKRRLLRIT
jgi:hypothetical protein